MRAFAPFPGSWFEIDGERIKVLRARTIGVNGADGHGARRRADDRLRRRPPIRPLVVQRAGQAGAMTRPKISLRGNAGAGGDSGSEVTRFALTLEFDGGPFMGLQRQEHGPSVQQAVEQAVHAVTGET